MPGSADAGRQQQLYKLPRPHALFLSFFSFFNSLFKREGKKVPKFGKDEGEGKERLGLDRSSTLITGEPVYNGAPQTLLSLSSSRSFFLLLLFFLFRIDAAYLFGQRKQV